MCKILVGLKVLVNLFSLTLKMEEHKKQKYSFKKDFHTLWPAFGLPSTTRTCLLQSHKNHTFSQIYNSDLLAYSMYYSRETKYSHDTVVMQLEVGGLQTILKLVIEVHAIKISLKLQKLGPFQVHRVSHIELCLLN